MITPTYIEQREKIVQAYLKCEIEPYDPKFCFCGNLCDNSTEWFGLGQYHKNFYGYTATHFVEMETALLVRIHEKCNTFTLSSPTIYGLGGHLSAGEHPVYEQALFSGMVAALEVLRQIHLEMGDETAKEIPLVKRSLVNEREKELV